MAEVRFVAKRVEDEDVQVLEERQAFIGNIAHVGEIGSVAETVTGNLLATVGDGDLPKLCSEDIDD